MITRIEIENFKSIQKADLELRPINVLIGANGAGKSNFINFFKLLNKIYEQQLQNYVAYNDYADNILHFGAKNSSYLSGRIEFDNINAYSFRLSPNNNDSLYFLDEIVEYNTKHSWHIESKNEGHKESKLRDTQTNITKYVMHYLSSYKIYHFHDTSDTAKIKKMCKIEDSYILHESGDNLAGFLHYISTDFPKNFKKIQMTVGFIAPFFERFELAPEKENKDMIRLRWKEKGMDMILNASHLSDGTLRFIALTTLLLQPDPPSIIIIDEPELGLHPFAISILADLIQKISVRSQVIISTQSVGLVDNFEPEDIIVVDRRNKKALLKRQSKEALEMWLENYSIGDLWLKNVIGGQP